MIKHAALTIATTATLSVLATAPAMAQPTFPGSTNTALLAGVIQDVPEPTTVLGLLTVGGGLISKRLADKRKASK